MVGVVVVVVVVVIVVYKETGYLEEAIISQWGVQRKERKGKKKDQETKTDKEGWMGEAPEGRGRVQEVKRV